MHVKHPQSALLSNHETLLHLQAEQAEPYVPDEHGRERKMPKELGEVLRDGIVYLTNPDYATAKLHEDHPNRPMTLYKGPNSLLRALAPKYRLNKSEYLQIYNIRPKSQITLQLVIEEATTRFSEEELEDVLEIIGRVFDEEEASIPKGVEDMKMAKLASTKMGATRKARRLKKTA